LFGLSVSNFAGCLKKMVLANTIFGIVRFLRIELSSLKETGPLDAYLEAGQM
jgi:hypothetical protein